MSEKFRIEKRSNFTVVSNDILMNNFMSMKATCLLLKMLGKPDNWDYTINGMKTFCKEGRDAIRSALNELEYFGYLERRKVRDQYGRFTDIEYIIYEVPISSPPQSGYPETENPSLDNPSLEKPPVINKEINKNRKNKKRTQASIDSTPSPPSRSEMNEATESVREQIEYDLIIGEDGYDSELVDEAVVQMVEAICSTKPNIRVAGENRSADVVRSRLLELNRFHVEFVLDCMRENTTEIRNIRAYLLTALYNAPFSMGSYYAAKVRHDMRGGVAT